VGHPKITYFYVRTIEGVQQICWLDVAVDDALIVDYAGIVRE
jgi:hypothetical protein